MQRGRFLPYVRGWGEDEVAYVYYALLGVYAIWGTLTLAWLNPLQIATIGAVLGNVALGFSAFHIWYVNRTLLPPELRPGLLMQSGLIAPSACEREYGRHVALSFPRSRWEALATRLLAAGAELIEPQRETPFRRLFFRDPNGYMFEVIAS